MKSTLFLTRRFYIVLAVLVFITGLGSFVPPMFLIGRWLLVALGVLLLLEAFLLYHERGIMARRTMVTPSILQHRLVLTAEAEMEGYTAYKVAQRLIDKVEVPK